MIRTTSLSLACACPRDAISSCSRVSISRAAKVAEVVGMSRRGYQKGAAGSNGRPPAADAGLFGWTNRSVAENAAGVPQEPRSHHFNSLRLGLHYVTWGSPDAPPLILLHGGKDHCRSWDATARAFAPDRYVVAPDLRGHGDSDWSPDGSYGGLAHARDLRALVRHLGGAPLAIVAHSYGGHVALRFAGIYPELVTRLVAIEGLWRYPDPDLPEEAAEERIRRFEARQHGLAGARQRRYASLEEAAARMRASNPRLSPELADHLALHGARRTDDGGLGWKFDPLGSAVAPIDLSYQEQKRLWSRIACPVLLVDATESHLRNRDPDRGVGFFADARAITIADAGHWVQHDQSEIFLKSVRDFLA